MGNTSQSYGTLPAVGDYTVLPAIGHRWMHPDLTPTRQLNLPTLEGGRLS